MNETMFSWKNFYEYVIYLFHSCYYSHHQTSSLENNKFLYKCHRSDRYISIYRVKDRRKDCLYNDDEDDDINVCSLNLTNAFTCLINEDECIQQVLIMDKEYDCSDESDEYFDFSGVVYVTSVHKIRLQRKIDFNELYRFQELCDHIVNRPILYKKTNETDESDCDYWPSTCNSIFTRCNNIWNCQNGLDEVKCFYPSFTQLINQAFKCKDDEHYCLKLINNNTNDINMTCIHINRIGDGVIDCIGGTDERFTSLCIQNYPYDHRKRFSCMNSSRCIEAKQVCNGIVDCPSEDDERVCPWLFHTNASQFYCQYTPSNSITRCQKILLSSSHCSLRENLWFCDLEVQYQQQIDVNYFVSYPPRNQNIKAIAFYETINSDNTALSNTRTLSLINSNNSDIWLCNQGYLIQSSLSDNKTYCLCSPAFYGDYCQYQSERISIVLRIQILYYINPSTVYHLMICLLDDDNQIISYDEIIYNQKASQLLVNQFFIYLIDEQMKNVALVQRTESKSVRIDSYIINETSVQYISSLLYNVSYPFLPVNRLVILVPLEDESFEILECQKQCGMHGKCMYYLNAEHLEYCWCEQGWYGHQCQLKSPSNLCNQTSCSPHSQCMIIDEEKQQMKCVCPLGRSGKECYIRYSSCMNDRCQNNGTCLSLDQRVLSFICICQDGYRGIHCEDRESVSNVSIPANITTLTQIPAIILITTSRQKNDFFIRNRYLYTDVTLPTTLKIPERVDYWFLQMYHNSSTSFYYVIAIQEKDTRPVNTSVISSNLCPNVSDLFNKTILQEYSYLKRLKLYHLPCQQNQQLRCFYDEYRICLCTREHNTDCYVFIHDYGDCSHCTNNGVCLQRNVLNDQWNYICLCPSCTYGRHCEFSTGNYFITFEMLVGIDMHKNDRSFSQQPFIIYFTLIILILFLLFSCIFNTISLMIFSKKKLRQVGCDFYLLCLTIISQIGLVLLFLRFVYMIITQMYVIKNVLFVTVCCKFLEYSIRLIPSVFDWLTVCISMERTYTIVKDVRFTKVLGSKTLKLSYFMVMIVIVLNILTTLHRPFYLLLIDEPTVSSGRRGHSVCVLNFESSSWSVYEKMINIVHLSAPFVLNVISLIYFLFYKTKLESTTTLRISDDSKLDIFMNQVRKYKPLAIGTLMIILLETPRFVSTFVLSCIEYQWQRYVYLMGYLISFLPLTGILFLYVLPSPKYKQEYIKITKKRFSWLSIGNRGRN